MSALKVMVLRSSFCKQTSIKISVIVCQICPGQSVLVSRLPLISLSPLNGKCNCTICGQPDRQTDKLAVATRDVRYIMITV